MQLQTLFKSFNNNNTTTEKQRDKEHKYQKEEENWKIIYQWDIVCQILMWKNYKEQYTNNKKETKELKLKWLRTASHVGYTGHRPVRNITIER